MQQKQHDLTAAPPQIQAPPYTDENFREYPDGHYGKLRSRNRDCAYTRACPYLGLSNPAHSPEKICFRLSAVRRSGLRRGCRGLEFLLRSRITLPRRAVLGKFGL